jgi:lysylphosphatidylglycerol synthetase-like protein (DUF2156 family)
MDNKVHKTKTIQWTIKYTKQSIVFVLCTLLSIVLFLSCILYCSLYCFFLVYFIVHCIVFVLCTLLSIVLFLCCVLYCPLYFFVLCTLMSIVLFLLCVLYCPLYFVLCTFLSMYCFCFVYFIVHKYTTQKQYNGQYSTQDKNNTMDIKVHKTKTIQWTIKYTRQNNIMEMHFETFMFLLL